MTDYAKESGDRGEKVVANIAQKYSKNQRIISNYMFKTYDGKTAQIDHIIIRNNGIFVIEVKNYAGTIYGKADSKEWIQVINEKAYPFYNPIKQNFGHIYKIKENILGKKPKIYNIVVFTKADISNIYDTQVMNLEDFEKNVFHTYENKLDWAYIDYYYNELCNYRYRVIEEEKESKKENNTRASINVEYYNSQTQYTGQTFIDNLSIVLRYLLISLLGIFIAFYLIMLFN